MGLDMYLYAEAYVARWDHSREDEIAAADSVLAAAGLTDLQTDNAGVVVKSTAIYWRKANAVHAWFVENVQAGVDDCGEYYVSRDHLTELLDVCKKVLAASEVEAGATKVGSRSGPDTGGQMVDIIEERDVIANPEVAEELLPVQSGFFFGNTGYNEFYLADVKHTAESIERILALDTSGVDFQYHSSW